MYYFSNLFNLIQLMFVNLDLKKSSQNEKTNMTVKYGKTIFFYWTVIFTQPNNVYSVQLAIFVNYCSIQKFIQTYKLILK